MPAIEAEGGPGGGGRSGNTPNRFSQGSDSLREKRGGRGGRGSSASSSRPAPPPPGPIPGSRFDPARLRQLTPYAMPVPVPQKAPDPQMFAGAPGARAGRPTLPQEQGQGFITAAGPGSRGGARPLATATEPTLKEQPGKERTRRVYQLTWDEYNKLSDEQRAAVDYNTVLVQAREKDLNTDYNATEEQRKHFNEQAEKMFGEGRGSETFAPETLAVLKDIDFKSSGTDDLDDFLGLKTAITAKDLKGFSFERRLAGPEIADPYGDMVRAAISPGGAGGLESDQRAAVYNRNLQETMAKAGELLQTWRASSARHRNDEVLGLGGLFNEVKKAPGYGNRPSDPDKGNFHGFAQDSLAALANPKMDVDTVFASINSTLRGNEKQQIMRYFDEQTRNALEFGTGVLGLDGKKLRSPEEIRQLLGLDKRGKARD